MDKKHKIAFWVNAVFAYLIVFFSILYLTRHFFEVDIMQSPYILKTISSVLFVLCGLFNLIYCFKTGMVKNKKFMIFMFTGLVFAMLGDVLLIDFFVIGAALFAIGHIFFFIAFCTLSKMHWLDFVIGGGIFAIALLIIFLYKGFEFGSMLVVVIAYALIISLMLGKAGGNLRLKNDKHLNFIIFFGALMFFLSDLMLLFNVFASAPYIFDILCLALYYPAEFILAFSIYFAGAHSEKDNSKVKETKIEEIGKE